MAGSLIYVGTHAITPGKLEVAKEVSRELGAFLEANHPRMLHFGIYIDDDAHEMTVIQIHPDEDSLRLHMELARERIAKAYEFLTTTRIDIYGTPERCPGRSDQADGNGCAADQVQRRHRRVQPPRLGRRLTTHHPRKSSAVTEGADWLVECT